MSDDGTINALKISLDAAERGLLREKKIHQESLERMLGYMSQIEGYREHLRILGVKTLRTNPWGRSTYAE